jgi:hypothetical protein
VATSVFPKIENEEEVVLSATLRNLSASVLTAGRYWPGLRIDTNKQSVAEGISKIRVRSL